MVAASGPGVSRQWEEGRRTEKALEQCLSPYRHILQLFLRLDRSTAYICVRYSTASLCQKNHGQSMFSISNNFQHNTIPANPSQDGPDEYPALVQSPPPLPSYLPIQVPARPDHPKPITQTQTPSTYTA